MAVGGLLNFLHTRLAPMLLLVAAAAWPLQSQTLNRNLIANPGAEDSLGVRNASDAAVNVSNWTTTGGFSVGTYDGGDFLSSSDFGPVSRGKQLFYAGSG